MVTADGTQFVMLGVLEVRDAMEVFGLEANELWLLNTG
mgnify:CR=1 FL=1